jgi:hypothetical protein
MMMGDQINMVGAVRYLRKMYDEVHLTVMPMYADQMKIMYRDDPGIKLIETIDEWTWDHRLYADLPLSNYDQKDVYVCGLHCSYYNPRGAQLVNGGHYIYNYYIMMGLPPVAYWDCFSIPETSHLPELKQPYFFIHRQASWTQTLNVNEIEKISGQTSEDILYIDPNFNVYQQGHHYYQLADQYVGHPVIDYISVMKGATRLYLVNSCFFCLAIHLPLQTRECYVRPRSVEDLVELIWDPQYGYHDDNLRVFKRF